MIQKKKKNCFTFILSLQVLFFSRAIYASLSLKPMDPWRLFSLGVYDLFMKLQQMFKATTDLACTPAAMLNAQRVP